MAATRDSEQTTARYRACLASHSHHSGLRMTLPRAWQGQYLPFGICDSCDVPVTPAHKNWSSGLGILTVANDR